VNIANARAVLTIPNKWHGEIKSKNFPHRMVYMAGLYHHVQVAAHHGGAGTTSASLHAGIPVSPCRLPLTNSSGVSEFIKLVLDQTNSTTDIECGKTCECNS
jgi:hypothetical protein